MRRLVRVRKRWRAPKKKLLAEDAKAASDQLEKDRGELASAGLYRQAQAVARADLARLIPIGVLIVLPFIPPLLLVRRQLFRRCPRRGDDPRCAAPRNWRRSQPPSATTAIPSRSLSTVKSAIPVPRQPSSFSPASAFLPWVSTSVESRTGCWRCTRRSRRADYRRRFK